MRMIKLTKVNTNRFNDNEDGEGQQPTPAMINVEAIRCFYPRRNGQPGTRLTFKDGGGFAVTETFDEVTSMVAGDALN